MQCRETIEIICDKAKPSKDLVVVIQEIQWEIFINYDIIINYLLGEANKFVDWIARMAQ